MEGRTKMTAKEEREILIKEIERLLKDANNRELNFVYTMLLNMR